MNCKSLIRLVGWLFCLQVLISCSEDEKLPNGYIETTVEGSSTMVLEGFENSALGFTLCKPEGFGSSFYIQDRKFVGANYVFVNTNDRSLATMQSEPTEGWQSGIEIEKGTLYWARCASLTDFKYVKVRVAYIEGNDVGIEYLIGGTEARPNMNANSSATIWAQDWEMPKLNADNYFVAHSLIANGANVLNYAYEWNNSKKHAEWVAFYFDQTTCQDVTDRTDAWDVDPLLPVEMQTSNANHTNDGFDRGHLCASEDRVWSAEANKQTFYFSNMSPQLASFNQDFWVNVEALVRKWGRAIPGTYEKVYVTKGGTLNQLLVNYTGEVKGADGNYPITDENGFTIKGLACPKYYFVAVLALKLDGTYQSIGILAEHKEGQPKTPTAEELQQYAMSIDNLETFAGVDFFCNLPDDLENSVECNFAVNDWTW